MDEDNKAPEPDQESVTPKQLAQYVAEYVKNSWVVAMPEIRKAIDDKDAEAAAYAVSVLSRLESRLTLLEKLVHAEKREREQQ